MRPPNYRQARKQKEQSRKQRQSEKLQRRLARPKQGDASTPAGEQVVAQPVQPATPGDSSQDR
jgi:hypothetical protein